MACRRKYFHLRKAINRTVNRFERECLMYWARNLQKPDKLEFWNNRMGVMLKPLEELGIPNPEGMNLFDILGVVNYFGWKKQKLVKEIGEEGYEKMKKALKPVGGLGR